MKWILFIMLFTTAPAEAPKKPPKVPVEKVWALQSTSTLDFVTEDACMHAGARITESIAIASTLNLRGWCFCESIPGEGKECPPEETKEKSAGRFKKFLASPPQGGFSARGFEPSDK
jgi:hypothetical protein